VNKNYKNAEDIVTFTRGRIAEDSECDVRGCHKAMRLLICTGDGRPALSRLTGGVCEEHASYAVKFYMKPRKAKPSQEDAKK
jgi:hypothetical protein